MLKKADAVITMTEDQKGFVQQIFPWSKVYTLGEAAGFNAVQIKDPFGGTLQDYEQTLDILSELVTLAMERLTKKETGGKE